MIPVVNNMKSMKKILLIISFVSALKLYPQSVEVPNGVIYHKTSAEKNEEAKKTIKNSIALNNSKFIFGSSIMVGPNLWSKFLTSKFFNHEMGIDLNFKIPTGNKVVTRKGKIIKRSDEFNSLWTFISENLKQAKIRIPTESEIEYYWSIIAYEIEEPLYVLESPSLKVLFNLNPIDNKLIFVEAL